ncbi:hypothetical protein ETW23_03915 [Leisingera sp. NJS201]|uniref:DUF6950 family protein n=1 Tax=Leisingera sp. NJS201 TaxID=2508306 RepID=UPI0010707400|nr:hypothetical protein [Leisingera sp. NJS201]QBR35412.1 hypothetical protein ETW23_03915 [Leisingera sp. NJS201]
MDFPAPSPRLPDWRPRLTQYLARVAALPFRPGAHDCVLFAAGAVEAMTGTDLAVSWRGTYRRLEDGQAALQGLGFEDHLALAAALFAEVPPSFAQAGDLGVFEGGGPGGALGIVQGAAAYVLRPEGMAVVSRLHMQRAFRV